MPTYTFMDKETGEIFDVIMRMSDCDEYKKQHPNHERYFDEAPSVISGTGSNVDGGFKEVLSKISEAHPNSPLADQTLRKTIKQARTERVIKEWKNKNKK